ncbi:hypothetical protein ACTFIR_000853 [Dictyostelium discoideum]
MKNKKKCQKFAGHPQSVDALVKVNNTFFSGSSDGIILFIGLRPKKLLGVVEDYVRDTSLDDEILLLSYHMIPLLDDKISLFGSPCVPLSMIRYRCLVHHMIPILDDKTSLFGSPYDITD